MTSPGVRLAGLVVHWRDEDNLERLFGVWPFDDPRFELVVVDNASTRPLRVPAAVRWIDAGENLGFAGGMNRAARATAADILLLLNPDARPRRGALAALLEGFALHPEAAGLAPRLAVEAWVGRRQEDAPWRWQLARLPRRRDLLARAWFGQAHLGPDREPAAGTTVGQPAAAALGVRRVAYERLGGLDEGFFPAWYEDVDFAARAASAGLRFLYWPAAEFEHSGGGSLPALGFAAFYWLYDRHLVRYAARHHGPGFARFVRWQQIVATPLRAAFLVVRLPHWTASRREALRALRIKWQGAWTSWRKPTEFALRFAAPPADRETPPSVTGERVAICVVTRNAAADLLPFFEHMERQDHRNLEVVICDNASDDETSALVADAARRLAGLAAPPFTLRHLVLPENLGFAAGMNRAIAATDAPWILSLNADTRPRPDFVRRLLERALTPSTVARAGAVTGRLLRFPIRESVGEPAAGDPAPTILDACGMRWSLAWRHFDRGAGEVDRGQYARAERVAGGTGAATLYRRAALEDVAVDGWIFDEDFHSYREDAELALRLEERGWETIYEPAAVALHRRVSTPERRRAMSADINRHSLKNRYLLRLYHQGAWNALFTAGPTLLRDLLALLWVLAVERSSLPAYGWLWRERRRLLARRRVLRARRTASPRAVDGWFWRSGRPL